MLIGARVVLRLPLRLLYKATDIVSNRVLIPITNHPVIVLVSASNAPKLSFAIWACEIASLRSPASITDSLLYVDFITSYA